MEADHQAQSTGRPVPTAPLARTEKAAYALGGVGDTFGHWLYASLAWPVFNLHLGLSPTLVGAVLMGVRLVEACLDPLFGWLSDNTRSRWGRRRPFILAGSVLAGLALPTLFLLPSHWDASQPWLHNRVFWFMLVSALLYVPLISLYSMPYASLGGELTPDSHERTSAMAWKVMVQKGAGLYVAAAWWLSRSWASDPATGAPDVLRGARWVVALAGVVMVVAGVATFRGVRERYYARARLQAPTRFWGALREVFGSRAFVTLLGAVVLGAAALALGNDLGLYVGTYHVFGGDQEAMSHFRLYAGVAQVFGGVLAIPATTVAARRFGKRAALLGVLAFAGCAYGGSWWLFTPARPWLMVLDYALMAMAATALWVLAPSMSGDVVDDDELRSGQRREGAFVSWMSWAVKFVLALCLLGSGSIVDHTGFAAPRGGGQLPGVVYWLRVWLAVVPVAALALAGGILALYPLTRARMAALRAALEARRGSV